MNSYSFLAGCYDRLTYDVDYTDWADYIEKHFRRRGLPGNTVLDLACGTGSLTYELAQRGYEMIGVDMSPEMLSEAAEKNENVGGIPPMFLCQPMEQLDLFGDYVRKQEHTAALAKERRRQEAILQIKHKYGKNAILRGMNLEDGATAIQRNNQIGGHKA